MFSSAFGLNSSDSDMEGGVKRINRSFILQFLTS